MCLSLDISFICLNFILKFFIHYFHVIILYYISVVCLSSLLLQSSPGPVRSARQNLGDWYCRLFYRLYALSVPPNQQCESIDRMYFY